jgi:chorismate dehydratase
LKKIKVGAVSYLNTKPLLYGIEHSDELMQRIEMVRDYPSRIAKQLLDNNIDIGLVPVAIIPKLKEYISFQIIVSALMAMLLPCVYSAMLSWIK